MFALVHCIRPVTFLCTAECESERLQSTVFNVWSLYFQGNFLSGVAQTWCGYTALSGVCWPVCTHETCWCTSQQKGGKTSMLLNKGYDVRGEICFMWWKTKANMADVSNPWYALSMTERHQLWSNRRHRHINVMVHWDCLVLLFFMSIRFYTVL